MEPGRYGGRSEVEFRGKILAIHILRKTSLARRHADDVKQRHLSSDIAQDDAIVAWTRAL